ncbi:hypothetical protein [Bradyrhizobium sp. CB2312]|uniref:hypothetical protein n=1 Tax=Bradyrhizobium sp. CB2312 TaxID=3039155 RepID=UPI0024B14371|nr:hypothetical protein [Bradyrhizobium sp. CB2312]WFU76618.1 hypothetical protein QA642_22725 [Bradyrhizobium sp. CB2312]
MTKVVRLMWDFDLFSKREWLLMGIGLLLLLGASLYGTFWFINYYLASASLG